MYKGPSIRLTLISYQKPAKPDYSGMIPKVLKGKKKTVNQEFFIWENYPSKIKEKKAPSDIPSL